MKKIVFTFGRYNPPTTGHAELITYAVKLAHRTGAEHRIYTSQSHDSSKNPLAPREKMMFLRQIFPGVNFVDDPAMKTAFAICKKLADEGYEDVTFVVGDDRVAEFKTQLGKYVKPKTAKDFNPKIHYPFKKFKVESSGARKQGISGTDLRAAVRKGDFATFAKASAARDKTLARKIFTATRKQLSEEVEISEVTAREMHKHLTSKGWNLERKGKSHDLYSHPQSKGRRITLPRHPGDLDRRLTKEIDKQTDRYIREETTGLSRKDFHDKLMSFVDFTCDHLGIDERPTVQYKEDGKEGCQPSFASYSPGDKVVSILTKNRHPMDIFRSVAHELVHHKQNLDGRLGKNIAKEGATGSKIENEANSEAGKIMRYFGSENPFYFDMQYVTEQENLNELNKGVLRRYKGAAKTDRNRLRVDSSNRNEGNPNKKSPEYYERKIKNRTTGIDRASERYDGEKPYSFKEEKAIILAGTPGSGKDKILKEAIIPFGYTEISVDNFNASDIHGNIVVNGTSDYEKIVEIKEALEIRGYETMMVFVNTSNEVSKQRNEARGLKGGRVISENVRFSKWKNAQDCLTKYSSLFEKVIEVNNDLDLNESREVYNNLINNVYKQIEDFSMSEQDRRFENMLNESKYRDFSINDRKILVGGAGNWGVQKLTDRYKSETPGQEPGQFKSWKVLDLKSKIKEQKKPEPEGKMTTAPIPGDRIGDEAGMAKGPGFGDNQSLDFTGVNSGRQIDRWMVKEETRRRFKEKYGALADKKLKETAEKIARMESLVDPFSGTTGDVTSTLGNDIVRYDQTAVDQEKSSIFGKKKYKKTK